jgi:hypothetical protein
VILHQQTRERDGQIARSRSSIDDHSIIAVFGGGWFGRDEKRPQSAIVSSPPWGNWLATIHPLMIQVGVQTPVDGWSFF